MSSTTTTNTESSQKAPELTIVNRVLGIPLVASSIEKVDGTLSANLYTRSPYSTAKGLSDAAYKFSEPLQIQLSPILCRADQFANKAVDFVEARYPFPLKATPEQLYGWVRETQQSYADYASRTIDERVKSPAFHVAQGIDKSFAPVVNIFEDAYHRFGSQPTTPTSESANGSPPQYQYQRAISLSKALRNEIQVYSDERIKELQNHSTLVNRATETAHTVVAAANASVASAQARVQALSNTMISQVQKLQSQLYELQSSASAAYQNGSQHIPELQKSLQELSSELHEIITAKDVPIQDKALRAGNQVKERVTPVLETMKRNVSEFLEKAKARSKEVNDAKPARNGNSH